MLNSKQKAALDLVRYTHCIYQWLLKEDVPFLEMYAAVQPLVLFCHTLTIC